MSWSLDLVLVVRNKFESLLLLHKAHAYSFVLGNKDKCEGMFLLDHLAVPIC